MIRVSFYTVFFAISFLFFSCKKEEPPGKGPINYVNYVVTCEEFEWDVSSEKGQITMNWNAERKEAKIVYLNVKEGSNPDKGKEVGVSGTRDSKGFTVTKTHAELDLTPGESYYFFIQVKCNLGSSWGKKKIVAIK